MSETPRIVVLTPVRNEAWILERFLAVTSQFADLIIVADQRSEDESVAICRRFPKVTVIANRSVVYDEEARQRLLINEARRRVEGPRILLASDADEILAADALRTPGWATMLQARAGTVLAFEKPDLYGDPSRCIRYAKPWPVGFVDDGSEHLGRAMHSIRVPRPPGAPVLEINDVRFLHYAFTRTDAQRSKERLYSVIENALNAQPLRRRWKAYGCGRRYCEELDVTPTPPEWFRGWEEMGIDMRSVTAGDHHWQDLEVLRYFRRFGERRFWLDDIWDADWEGLRQHFLRTHEATIPEGPIKVAPSYLRAFVRSGVMMVRALAKIRDAAV